MKYVHLTWYLLVDGTHADPNDVAPGEDGVLRHENGLAVALHEDGTPMSVGVGAIENKNVEAAIVAEETPVEVAREAPVEPEPKAESEAAKAKDMKPSTQKAGYKTRESKAR